MAKVYGGVEGIRKPAIGDWKTYESRAESYIGKIVDYAKANGHGPEAGRIIRFGVADGKAQYVVFSLKPVVLIHLDVWDGYQFQYVNRLTASDVRDEIARQEALEKLFSERPLVEAGERKQ